MAKPVEFVCEVPMTAQPALSALLFWYVPTGIIEGVVSSSLIVSLSRLKGVKLLGLEMCRKQEKS